MSTIKTKIAFIFFTLLYLFSSTVIPTFAAITYTYDADGNMTSDGTNCYTYNDANQLSQVKNCGNGQVIAQYTYDYQGTRIEKKEYTNGNLQQTIYSPTKAYETKKLANNTVQNTTYYYANSQLLARKNPDGSKTYYQNDNLNSANILTDQNGNLVEKTTYYPYGEIRSGGTQSKYLFTGQENDSETGLDYYNSRYYDSHIHRFIQPDTLLANVYDPQALNRYSYVENNPLTHTDPTGHFVFAIPLLYWAIAAVATTAVWSVTPEGHAAITSVANTVVTGASVAINAVKNVVTSFHSNNISLASSPKPSNTSSSGGNSSDKSISSGGNSPKLPNMNPIQKIAPLAPIASGLGNVNSGRATVDQALTAGESWLGEDYTEIAPGVFRSADNLRQFRMTVNDITALDPHVHFESIGEDTKTILENGHLYLDLDK